MRVFGFLSHTENVFFFVDRMSIFIYYFLRIFRFIYSFSILYSLAFFRFCFCRMMRARVVTSATKMIINEREKTLFFFSTKIVLFVLGIVGWSWFTHSQFFILFFSRDFLFAFRIFACSCCFYLIDSMIFDFFVILLAKTIASVSVKKKLQIFPIPFPNVSVCVCIVCQFSPTLLLMLLLLRRRCRCRCCCCRRRRRILVPFNFILAFFLAIKKLFFSFSNSIRNFRFYVRWACVNLMRLLFNAIFCSYLPEEQKKILWFNFYFVSFRFFAM